MRSPLPRPSKEIDLRYHPWFLPATSRQQAEDILRSTSVGTFLIRTGSSGRFVLSIKSAAGAFRHIQIEYNEATKVYRIAESDDFKNLEAMVAHYTGSGDVSGVLLGQVDAVMQPLGNV